MSNVGKRIYKVVRHPADVCPIFRVYEIVGETDTQYTTQIRCVSSKRAMSLTSRILKYHVDDETEDAVYAWSPAQAANKKIEFMLGVLRRAERRVKEMQQDLEEMREFAKVYLEGEGDDESNVSGKTSHQG